MLGRRAMGAIRRARRTLRDRADLQELSGIELLPLESGRPIGDLAQRLDMGVRGHVSGQTHRYDIRQRDVAPLLVSAAASAQERGLRLWAHAGGALTPAGHISRRTLARVLRSGRARLLVSTVDNRLAENLCIEIWRPLRDGSWRSILPDAPVTRIRLDPPSAAAPEPRHLDSVPDFPIDAVITWVNAADPDWRASVSHYQDLDALDPERFVQLDELRYSLRSIEMFAPWIRRIHILTNCAPPEWFVPSDRVRWVQHDAVIPHEYLPLFNSDAIETFLHRIPELSERYLYFNDDFLLANSVFPGTFFTADGRTTAFLSPMTSTIYLEQLLGDAGAREFEGGRVVGARLLFERFGTLPTRIPRHVPYAQTQSGWRILETEFAPEVEATRLARFRSRDVASFAAFVYPHYALLTGAGVLGAGRQYRIAPATMRRLSRRTPPRRDFANVAPSGEAPRDPEFAAFVSGYLDRHWPFASAAERPNA